MFVGSHEPPTPLLTRCALSVAPGVPHFSQNPSDRTSTTFRVRRSSGVTLGGLFLNGFRPRRGSRFVVGAGGVRFNDGLADLSPPPLRRVLLPDSNDDLPLWRPLPRFNVVVPRLIDLVDFSGVFRWRDFPCFTRIPSTSVAFSALESAVEETLQGSLTSANVDDLVLDALFAGLVEQSLDL